MKGKLKIYIGMSAGVGKSYRMLQDAHAMLAQGIHVKVGFIETHNRKETHALLEGLPILPRREAFYKGKKVDEFDLNSILVLHPEWVIIDELAHSNIPGSKNEKRWQDIVEVLNAGINVITAVNIQHIESINHEVKKITGIEVQERVPDSFLQMADEVVNIDLTASELITRLKEGKIYDPNKVESALNNFFQSDKILQLRELALKEVATQVERKIDTEVVKPQPLQHGKILTCIGTNYENAKKVLRKSARLASHHNSKWYVLYVQTPAESTDKIPLDLQRHLINNFKLATELGAEVIQISSSKITEAIINLVKEKGITTVCMGKPHVNIWQVLLRTSVFSELLKELSVNEVDLFILS
jgi:two-component system sensor histidine kinase KdpD